MSNDRLKALANTPDGTSYADAVMNVYAYLPVRQFFSDLLNLLEENEALLKARNENAKLKGQRDAALARIKQMQASNSRMAEEWSSLKDQIKALEDSQAAGMEHIETLSDMLKVIKEHWIDYDHVFSIAVHEADQFIAAIRY